MGSLDLTSLVLETWTPKGSGAHRGHPGRKPSPEQVMQEMPSALKLYLRSSSTWMLVSGRKSSGARLAGRSRLANTRDRMRMETKSPARKGCCARQGWGQGWGGVWAFAAGASRALGKSCSLYGDGRGKRGTGIPREQAKAQRANLWVRLLGVRPLEVGAGCYTCNWWSDCKL